MGLIEVAMAKKLSLRDQLIGRFVLINDDNGDGYQGLLTAFDGTMARLEAHGSTQVRFVDGKSEHVLDLGRVVHVPTAGIKFVVEAALP